MLALGLEQWRSVLSEAICHTTGCLGIYERSDSSVRTLEGLEERVGVVLGQSPPDELVLDDGELTILVDIKNGAKTGLFLDQRANQKAASREALGREILNCFSYTGLFGLEAGAKGAKSVTDVEASTNFNLINSRQWQLNDFKAKHTIETANVFDYLRDAARLGSSFDMIILDPPAFTKSRANIEGAARGYNEINRMALKLLRPGGVLVTCSCSHHIHLEEFYGIVQRAAIDAKRQLKLIEQRGQPSDHPVLLNAPESQYLKCLIFAVD
jgi:23S rRNA (cytosine1962-C5)-methyltransferase